ncbi:MAG: hypothetical protein EXQ95_12055 [Alphaproteobacteria bacterium]|nr:hypothetical protein [Alphaproteobacteria bacterium]
MLGEDARAGRLLWRIRMAHTIVWAVFASSVVAIPVVTFAGHIQTASWLSLLVWVEVVILAANRLSCPLTGLATRYTEDRSDNFDIFLPIWLAKHNKLIFGSLFAIGELVLLWRWALLRLGESSV